MVPDSREEDGMTAKSQDVKKDGTWTFKLNTRVEFVINPAIRRQRR
jgi:hypothetical protein